MLGRALFATQVCRKSKRAVGHHLSRIIVVLWRIGHAGQGRSEPDRAGSRGKREKEQ